MSETSQRPTAAIYRGMDRAALEAAARQPVRLSLLAGRHHFSILEELAGPDGALVGQLTELITQA